MPIRPGDFSLSAFVAGFVCVLVGFTSSAVIVFQAAQASGAGPAETASWIWALGLGCGLTSIGLSLRYRQPVVTAWSTPGAALLVASTMGLSLPQATGVFMAVGLLVLLCGVTRSFERAMSRIPLPLAGAMLAGVLLRFGLEVFLAMQSQFLLVLAMAAFYLAGRRAWPRYAVLGALLAGVAVAATQGQLHLDQVQARLATPIFTAPEFSWEALVGMALPLFVVTMASQNVPGVATLRASGYDAPISPLISWCGLATLVLAPFGGFSVNLAAITAAICMGPEAHADRNKRYTAAVAAGLFYLLIGLFGATLVALLAAFPRELVAAIAGLALINTIGGGLATAVQDETQREPALLTFLVTASGVTLMGIGSAFWGLVAGVLAMLVLRRARR
ncbi:benzoate/H(+) symporter BenE family transporter [Orrella sp. JC864]